MKRFKGLDEVHDIIEKIYEDEKSLTLQQRLKKLREEADIFLLDRKLRLRRVNPKERKHISV